MSLTRVGTHTDTHTQTYLPVLGYWHWRLRGSFLGDIETDVNPLWWDISISFTLLHFCSQNTRQNVQKKRRAAKTELFNLRVTKSSTGNSGGGGRRTVNVLFTCLSAGALTGLMLRQSSLIEKGSALPGRVGCMSKRCRAWLILARVYVCVHVCV